VDLSKPGAALLPNISQLREVSLAVAEAVAQAAISDNVARIHPDSIREAIEGLIWEPAYRRVEAAIPVPV